MTARKRKSPKGANARQRPGLALSAAALLGSYGWKGLSGVGTLAARNPQASAGALVFLVVFSFIAANALWYQPGAHPHPFLRTRDPGSPRLFGRPETEPHEGAVTTFRIERQGSARQDSDPAAPQPQADGAPALAPDARDVGTTGATPAAPLLPGAPPSALPSRLAERPAPAIAPSDAGEDPVAAAIRAAEAGLPAAHAGKTAAPHAAPAAAPRPQPRPAAGDETPPRAIPASARPMRPDPAKSVKPQVAGSGAGTDVQRILKIQQGLSNMAYANIAIDGTASPATRAAIRNFQKHYNLPQTGEPDDAVLKKLKDIGAL